MKQTLTLLLLVSASYGAFEWPQLPALPRGMASSFTAISTGADALFWNPAGLTDGGQLDLLLSYEKPFGGLDASLRSGLVGVARKFGNVGVGLSFSDYGARLEGDYSGNYGEQLFSLSAAVPLNENIAFGMKFNYYRLSMPRFNPAGAFGIDMGVRAKFYSKWMVGLYAQNASAASFVASDGTTYRLPTALSFGVALQPYRNTLTSVDIRKEYGQPVTVALGQSVSWGRFTLRGGVQSQGDFLQFAVGMSAGFRGFRVDYAATITPDFPVTHTFTLKFGR